MCELCGCSQYIKQGNEAVLRRVMEIVKELDLTKKNVDDYEDTEIISRLIAPFGSKEDDVYPTAAWVSNLHVSMRRLDLAERYQAHVRAFRDIFSNLPAKGEPKHIATVYHQLEQLVREMDNADLAPLDPETKEVLQAVNHVHDGIGIKETGLKQRYGL